jgi:hypothetical protein
VAHYVQYARRHKLGASVSIAAPREIATESSVALQLSSTVALHPWFSFLVWTALCCLFFWKPLIFLADYSLNNDSASHILMIPVIAQTQAEVH